MSMNVMDNVEINKDFSFNINSRNLVNNLYSQQ
jgi:hypothetical protein